MPPPDHAHRWRCTVVSASGSLPLWAGALALRRWRTSSGLLALVLAVAVVAGSVLCGALLLVRSAEQSGVSGALSALPPDRVDVTVRVLEPSSPMAGSRADVDAATRAGYGPGVSFTSTGWATSDWATTPDGVYSFLAELDDPGAEAELVAGSWPTAAPGVALPESAARSLGLTVGGTLVLGGSGFQIDAVYRAGAGTFWENDPLLAQGDAEGFPEPDRSFYSPVHAVGPLLAAPGGVDASGIAPAQLLAVERPSFAQTGADGLTALRSAAGDAETAIALAAAPPGGTLFVDIGLPTAVDDVAAGLATTRAAALVVALLLVVVLAASASAVTRLLAESRAEELERLRERGATGLQRLGTVAVDALAVAVAIAAASPWGGVLLHALVASAPPLDAAGLPRWVLPDAPVVLCAVAVAAVVGLLLLRPAGRDAVRPPPAAAGPAAVVVVAALLVWRAAGPVGSGDLLLALTPTVLLSGLAIVGARLADACARPVAALAVRSRGAVAPLAGWFAARGSGRSSGVVLVALTVGASVIALGTSATGQEAVREEAAVAVGAPARLDESTTASPVLRRQSLVAKKLQEGVEAEAPGSAAQLLALDATARGLLAHSPDEQVRTSGSALEEALPASDLDETGPLLPRGTAALQARAVVTGPDGLQVALTAILADARGALTPVPLGALTAPAEPAAVTSSALDSSGDLRLVGVTATLSGAETEGAVGVDVVLDEWSAQGADGSAAPVALTDAATWAGSVQGDVSLPPEVEVGADALRITVGAQLFPPPLTYGAVGWNAGAPIGAVLPAPLADDLDVIPGADLTAFVAGTPVVLRVAGETAGVPGAATGDDLDALAAGLPSTSRAESTIVVDARALAHRLLEARASGAFADEYWSEADDRVPADAVSPGSLAERMLAAPLRAEIPATAAVVVWASLLLALAGFGARAAAVGRARRLEAAQLRAVGLSRRGVLAVLTADAIASALAGAVTGLLAGCAVLALVGTRIAGAGRADAVTLIIPWQALALVPIGLLLALGAVSLALALAQRRLPLPDLLRAGADG
ncbi:ABC transporter permease [Rathayibacter sp. AY2B1]|uniref:ABC transporter permease n=1 Tax=Rathayibacter sp. AY2B1 TaxID=2080568 RepID=UPI0011AFD50F|nr:ABC transporter permease [Rathayibacter sp. AY2B1]